MPTVSIVMPAYNAEKYIAEAILSVEKQSFNDWELIIVDDASTDDTLKIIEYYAQRDARIKYASNVQNSGSARLPRFKAISMAVSDWILGLDADDFIAEDCLAKIIGRAEVIRSDIVVGQMILINSKGESMAFIPQQGYDMSQIITGKQACAKTIGGWKIGFFLVRSEYFRRLPNDGHNEMNMDEVDTRRLLLMAPAVSFCDAIYYYRQNASSITKKISIKLFDRMHTSYVLMNIISDSFSKEDKVYDLAVLEFWGNVSNSLLFLFRYYSLFARSEKKWVIKTTKNYYKKSIEVKTHLKMNPLKKKLIFSGYPLFFLIKFVVSIKEAAKDYMKR